MKPKTLKKGFTLIELMIVIVIIGILTTIILPHIVNGRCQAQFTACQFNLRALAGALESYHADKGTYPRDANEYDKLFTSESGPPYLAQEPTCPTDDEPYDYYPDPDSEYTGKDSIHNYLLVCGSENGHWVSNHSRKGYPQYKPAVGLIITQIGGEEVTE